MYVRSLINTAFIILLTFGSTLLYAETVIIEIKDDVAAKDSARKM